jgi:cytochrome d ubiquinol oxidase subunit I
VPLIPMTYWSFRLMIGFGVLAALIAVAGLWFTRRKTSTEAKGAGASQRGSASEERTALGSRPSDTVPRWFGAVAVAGLAFPFAANSFGWIFTEMGRQPWVVYGVLRTADGVSPAVGTATVLTSLVVFTLLYGVLAVVEGVLMIRYATAGPRPPAPAESLSDDTEPSPLTVTY